MKNVDCILYEIYNKRTGVISRCSRSLKQTSADIGVMDFVVNRCIIRKLRINNLLTYFPTLNFFRESIIRYLLLSFLFFEYPNQVLQIVY